ncbi:hypothetical protein Lalb_Chr05g0227391 [Lupinus albus]|uniref:Uncharacterized protein n=1 Tax=Lupinus albus TaxID=3870 RepID=A0A6A4QMZ4_LUPAL|nr:hypothetical protein Lalb_Chr05g0227391 [Lupinus albus]
MHFLMMVAVGLVVACASVWVVKVAVGEAVVAAVQSFSGVDVVVANGVFE